MVLNIPLYIQELDLMIACSIDLEQVFLTTDILVEATKNDERWSVVDDAMKILEEHYKNKN